MNKHEAKLRDDIISFLTRPDVGFVKVNQTWGKPANTATDEGATDLLVMVNGYTDQWELKRPEVRAPNGRVLSRAGVLSPKQLEHIGKAARCGVDVQVIPSFEEAQTRIAYLRSLPLSPGGL